MPYVTVTSSGRITTQKRVRDELDLRAGDGIAFDVHEGDLVGRVRRLSDVMELFHRLPGVDGAAYDRGAESKALRRAAIAAERSTRSD